MEQQKNVLFSAQYDNSKLVAGVAEDIKALQALASEQKNLQSVYDTTQAKLDQVQSELSAVNKQINTLSKSTANYAEVQQSLTTQQTDLVKQQQTLSSQLQSQKARLDEVSASATKATESLTKISVAQQKIQDQAKNPIPILFDFSKALNGIQATKEELQSTLAGFDFSGFEDLQERLTNSKNEFEQLNVVLTVAQEKLQTLDPNTQEFQDLNQVVATVTKTLTAFDEVTDQSGTKTVSLRTRIKQLRDELTKLEDAGQEETEQYRKIELEAAKLTDQYGDMQQRIRILASDTRNLDFGVSLVSAAAAGFQTYTGVLEAFGVSSDTAQEAQRKLLAVMSIVQGIQQLQNLLLKENVIVTVGANIAQKALAATQKVMAAVFNTSTVAVKSFSAALLASGVGALVIALGYLISKISEWTDTTEEAAAAQEKLNHQLELQKQFFEEDLQAIDDYTAIRNERLKQQGFDEAAIYQSNRQAIADKIARINDELVKLDESRKGKSLEAIQELSKRENELVTQGEHLKQQAILESEKEQTRIIDKARADRKKSSDKFAQDQKAADDLLSQIRFELSLRGKSDEEKELANLRAKYAKEKAIIEKGGRSTVALTALYEKQRSDIIDKYAKTRADAERKIIADLDRLNIDFLAKRIENIQNQFEQETEAIKNESAKQSAELQDALNEALNGFLDQRTAGVITGDQYKAYVEQLNTIYDGLFQQLAINTTNKLKEVSAKAFQDGLQYIETLANSQIDTIHISANKEIIDISQLYVQGKINYDDYQKELTRIAQEETIRRLQIQRNEIVQESASIDIRINKKGISDKEVDELIQQRKDLQTKLSDLDKQIADAESGQFKTTQDLRLKNLHAWLNAYSNITDSILGFI